MSDKPTAAEIALAALHEEESPELERRAREQRIKEAEEKRERERVRQKAASRFKQSPIPQWFPDVKWEFVERSTFGHELYARHGLRGFFDVWRSGKQGDYDTIHLCYHTDGHIYFTPLKGWDHKRKRDEWWEMVKVQSAADVGRALRDDHSFNRMPDHLP